MRTSTSTVGTVERMLSLNRMPILAGLAPEDLAVVGTPGSASSPPAACCCGRASRCPPSRGDRRPRAHLSFAGRIAGVRTRGLRGRRGRSHGSGRPHGDRETDTLALELETDAVLEICEDHFPIFHHVLREMCRLLIDLVGRLPSPLYKGIFPPPVTLRAPTADLDLVERILFLRQVSPFVHVGINAIAELSRGMAEVVFPAGSRLWEEGQPAGTVMLVVSGTVNCVARGGEASFVTGPGAPLGAVESLAERPRWYTPVTLTKVTALQGSIEGLIDVFEDNFEMATAYLAVMARAQIRIADMRVSASGTALDAFSPHPEAPGAAARPESRRSSRRES
jgi:CRP-like cAMP-binding protein